MMSDYSKYSDEQLADRVELLRDRASVHHSEGDYLDQCATEFQAELDRRQLEAFWAAHPGLRLEVGDKLINNVISVPSEFKTLMVHSILIHDEACIIYSYFDNWIQVGFNMQPYWSGSVPLDVVRTMRQAYLQQEAGK